MNDYKELVENLREEAEAVQAIEWDIPICTENHIREAADAIEQLVKERDAAVDDLYELFTKDESPCAFCVAEHCDKCIIDYPYWQWRGVQEVDDG